jgi:hypothetical protein
LGDLHPNLVLEEFGVFEDILVEYKDVGEGGEDEVYDRTENPAFCQSIACK